ncbi:MAG: response regulator transcription factor [Akkermansiaceae bacterium]|nr:response regulator transcription factor [Armatimonadota bacterium]
MKLLVVEDDPGLAKVLRKALQEAGCSVRVVGDGADADVLIRGEPFDLFLLDVMLPGMDGFTLCRRARAAKIATPILLLTARDAVKDKVEGLDAGADDYLVKPFQVAELLARVRALLRRGVGGVAPVITVGDLLLDPATREARRENRAIRLSATEYSLLEYLMRNAGRVLTRSLILEHVWQYDFGGSDNVLDVYIGYLRGKIDKGFSDPLIRTVRGVGFVIESRGRGEA